MKAIRFVFTIPRYALGLALGKYFPRILWNGMTCSFFCEIPEPQLPSEEWVLVKTRYGGICGSDIGTIHLHTSRYYLPLNSLPLTFGHENVGTIVQVGNQVRDWQEGQRVVVEPLLWCRPRGFTDLCYYCSKGEINRCERVTDGDLAPGIYIDTCRDTGGSWSEYFVAHSSQIFPIPDQVNDENGLLVEPFAVGLHTALMGYPEDREKVLIIGAGTIGLCTLAALRALGSQAEIVVLARYTFQADAARKLGASKVISAARNYDYYTELAEHIGARLFKPTLSKRIMVGGFNRVFECVGSDESLDDALRLTRAGGQVILAGIPAIPKGIDWTPIIANELRVSGSSVYNHVDEFNGEKKPTFDIVIDWMKSGKVDLSWIVTHQYSLDQYDLALSQVSNHGRYQIIKGVFAFPP